MAGVRNATVSLEHHSATPQESLQPKETESGPGQTVLQEKGHNFLVVSHPLTGTHPLTASPNLKKLSSFDFPCWRQIILPLNSHLWLPSTQGIKLDHHRQALKVPHDLAAVSFSCLISTPSPLHTRLQNTSSTSRPLDICPGSFQLEMPILLCQNPSQMPPPL